MERSLDVYKRQMNHLTVDEAGFPNHQGPLDPQWLLILVLDVRTDTACVMWG